MIESTSNGVLLDRPFRNETLDLDKSSDTPTSVIEQFRSVIIFGQLYEQTSCDTLTADPTFTLIGKT